MPGASESSALRTVPRGLTGARSRLVRTRLTLLLTVPLALIGVVVAAGGVVLPEFPGGLARLLGARLGLRTFTLLGGGRAHHGLHVTAERQLLLLHEGDAHGGRVGDCCLVVLLAEGRSGNRVGGGVLGRRGGEGEQWVGVVMLRWRQGLVGGRRVLLEATAPGATAQRLRVQPWVQRRMEVRPAHLPASAAERPT